MGKRVESVKLNKNNYLDRDISWLYFNYRILAEAKRDDVPLYEKLNFLAIYSSNLDEFFRVRVAAAKKIAESNVEESKYKKKVLDEITRISAKYSKEYDETILKTFNDLKNSGICLVNEHELKDEQKKFVHEYFAKNVAGYIQPIILSKKANVSNVSDSCIYLACKLTKTDASIESAYALIALPVKECSRFIVLPDLEGKHYVMYIDDLVRFHLKDIFKCLDYDIIESYPFKFDRNAELEIESDPEEGVLKNILTAVKGRKSGLPVRTIFGENTPEDLINVVCKKLEITEKELVVIRGQYHNNKDLMKFPYFSDIPHLKYEKWPVSRKNIEESLIKHVQNKDLFLHVPYESVDTFINFLQECAISKDVTHIKASIYRAAKNSQVVSSLESASYNGKKVTCMVELMARFDESSNILISKKLSDAGCDIINSKEGFKVHGKVMLIKMKNGYKDMAIISTGNFHEGNAKVYTDCLLFTSDQRIVKDVETLFDFLETPYKAHTFKSLLVSPNRLYNQLVKLIKNEINNAKNGKEAKIQIKVNHITDESLVKLLYQAASVGVKIELLVRGNCSIKNIYPNIEIHGIIDKYLEHNRLFIFENGGNKLYFMGSSDLMPRNLYNRVEVITPLYDESIKNEIQYIFDLGFKDNTHSTLVTGNEEFIRFIGSRKKIRSQEELAKHYEVINND